MTENCYRCCFYEKCNSLLEETGCQGFQTNQPLSEEEWEVMEEVMEEMKEVMEKMKLEEIQNHLIAQQMHGIRFISKSKGRGRKRRKIPREVILIQYGIDVLNYRWRWWSGEDRSDKGRIPWDVWATEIFGWDFCKNISNPDDYLRKEFLRILRECGGKF